MDYNPILAGYLGLEQTVLPRRIAPGDQYLSRPYQTRWAALGQHENELAEALEVLLSQGMSQPGELARALNKRNCMTLDGQAWTESKLMMQIERYAKSPSRGSAHE